MSDKKSISDELTSGLGSIFSRVGELFHIFDLSYLIAGAITFSAFVFLYLHLGLEFPDWFLSSKWAVVAIIIVTCYICGLFAYAAGRFFSETIYRKKAIRNIMNDALNAHGLNDLELIKYYMNGHHDALYRQMWCEMAHTISDNQSTQHYYQNLIRYWSMSATYDGVAFAFLLWSAVLMYTQNYLWVIISLIAGVITFHRAFIYYEYQIRDHVAYYAMKYWPLIPNDANNTP
jgi:hypothetical protein